jgi:cleavage and polyadenylation specificity factor subunit 1
MVKKADGTWWPCRDYRRLNVQTQPDLYMCPNMADLSARLAGCRFFSKLDLKKGYFQVPVHPEDICKTAIITPFGTFEFVRMPFSLRNAGQTFQRLMDQVLRGLDYCFVYLDDILIASPTLQQHEEHLREVLGRLEQAGLVLNSSKCIFNA